MSFSIPFISLSLFLYISPLFYPSFFLPPALSSSQESRCLQGLESQRRLFKRSDFPMRTSFHKCQVEISQCRHDLTLRVCPRAGAGWEPLTRFISTRSPCPSNALIAGLWSGSVVSLNTKAFQRRQLNTGLSGGLVMRADPLY